MRTSCWSTGPLGGAGDADEAGEGDADEAGEEAADPVVDREPGVLASDEAVPSDAPYSPGIQITGDMSINVELVLDDGSNRGRCRRRVV